MKFIVKQLDIYKKVTAGRVVERYKKKISLLFLIFRAYDKREITACDSPLIFYRWEITHLSFSLFTFLQ